MNAIERAVAKFKLRLIQISMNDSFISGNDERARRLAPAELLLRSELAGIGGDDDDEDGQDDDLKMEAT